MARKKLTERDKATIMAMHFSGEGASNIADATGFLASTIDSFISRHKDDEQWQDLRAEKEGEVIETFTEVINLGARLLKKRLSRALTDDELLDIIISRVEAEKLVAGEKNRILSQLKEIKLQSARDIAIVIGTVSDKLHIMRTEGKQNDNSITFNDNLPEGESHYGD